MRFSVRATPLTRTMNSAMRAEPITPYQPPQPVARANSAYATQTVVSPK